MRWSFLGGMMLLCGLAQSALAGSAQIVLRQEATVAGGYVRLGEVAEITGDGSAQLAQVFLGPAPESGSVRQISREEVLRCLRARGLDAGIDLTGTPAVRVQATTVPAAPIPASAPATPQQQEPAEQTPAETSLKLTPAENVREQPAASRRPADSGKPDNAQNVQRELAASERVRQMLNQAVTEYLMKALSVRNPASVDVATDITRCMNLTAEMASVEIDALRSGNLPGRCSVNLLIKDNAGNTTGSGTADLQVNLTVTVPVLTRSLKQNEDVRPGDIVLRKVRYKEGMPVNPIDPADFLNMAADGMLRVGAAVKIGDFCPSLDVRKGQAVSVIADFSGFKVTEQAIAEADGRRGDTIPVTGLVSHNNYRVRITGPATAEPPMTPGAR